MTDTIPSIHELLSPETRPDIKTWRKMPDDSVGLLDGAEGALADVLPTAKPENRGLMAVLDLGGIAADGVFQYGPEASDDASKLPALNEAKMLMFVDLRDESGPLWVEGCDVPEGSTLAIIDARGVTLDEQGRVQRGVAFMKPGETIDFGRHEKGEHGIDIVGAMAVSSKHLNVAVDESGAVLVKDRGSTNGTTYRTGDRARDAVESLGAEHIRSEYFRAMLGETAVEDTVPLSWLNEFGSMPLTTGEADAVVGHEEVAMLINETEEPTQQAEAVEEAPVDSVVELNEPLPSAPQTAEKPVDTVASLNDNPEAPETNEVSPSHPDTRIVNIARRMDGEPPLTPSQEKDVAQGFKILETILGQNKKGGGTLGEVLRNYGSDPAAIMIRLRGDGAARKTVFDVLRTRVTHLSTQKDASDKPVFLNDVYDGRTKPINVEDSLNGETQIDSLDKVALLALRMLEGTFRYGDNVVKDKTDGGHHRDAAEKVLADFAKEQVVEKEVLATENEGLKKLFKDASEKMVDAGLRLKRVEDNLSAFERAISGVFEINQVAELLSSARRELETLNLGTATILRQAEMAKETLAEENEETKRDKQQLEKLQDALRVVHTQIEVILQTDPTLRKLNALIGSLYGSPRDSVPILTEIKSWVRQGMPTVHQSISLAKEMLNSTVFSEFIR